MVSYAPVSAGGLNGRGAEICNPSCSNNPGSAEALLKIMPQKKAGALTQKELFEKAGVITKTTGRRALNGLLAAGQIQRIGDGWKGNPYRYWRNAKGGSAKAKQS